MAACMHGTWGDHHASSNTLFIAGEKAPVPRGGCCAVVDLSWSSVLSATVRSIATKRVWSSLSVMGSWYDESTEDIVNEMR